MSGGIVFNWDFNDFDAEIKKLLNLLERGKISEGEILYFIEESYVQGKIDDEFWDDIFILIVDEVSSKKILNLIKKHLRL